MPHTWLELDFAPTIGELEKAVPTLSSEVNRFARDLEAEKARKPLRQSASTQSGGLRRLPLRRPIASQVRLPARLDTQIPATILRPRGKVAKRRTSAEPGAELQIAVQHIADAIRARLLGLRKGLQKFQSEFARFAATAHLFSLSISKRRTL